MLAVQLKAVLKRGLNVRVNASKNHGFQRRHGDFTVAHTGCCGAVWLAGLITDVRVISRRLVFIHASRDRGTMAVGGLQEWLTSSCDVGRWRLFSLPAHTAATFLTLFILIVIISTQSGLDHCSRSEWVRWCSWVRSSYFAPLGILSEIRKD